MNWDWLPANPLLAVYALLGVLLLPLAVIIAIRLRQPRRGRKSDGQ